MNVNWANHIEDASKIEPQQLIAYLEKHGWINQQVEWTLNPNFSNLCFSISQSLLW